ncbi:MAG TPA: hypothetical protein HA254_07695 [Candidatus Diapherotrites archaeon]|uniref:A-type ATP synthase subunit C n=1 Tax=Candidatus Iainarchaeum sp. TaxID=3101447 RepID=A0A7J4J220_9ARCH|nr:hypothetical protein [Candidatus Diapherotrites archaeon]
MGLLSQNMTARALKFGYANARVKAMGQGLLSGREINAMIDAKDNEEVLAVLEKTQYRPDLVSSALGERTIADRIELAATRNFARALAKIRAVTPKEYRERVAAIFGKYDIENIKTILISRHTNEPKEKIAPYIMESGAVSRGMLNRLMDAKGVKEVVVELGGTGYGRALERNMKPYEKEKDITVLLAALDDYYYKKLPQLVSGLGGDERIMLSTLRAQADIKNISNILRAKKAGMKEEKIAQILISGGNVTRDRLILAAGAKSVEDAMKQFERSHRLGRAIEAYKKNASLIPAEIELEHNVAKRGLKALHNSVLSLGAIIGFLFLKEEETANIRKIVRAKEFNLGQEKIREMVIA